MSCFTLTFSLLSYLPFFFFCTTRVAFTKGPQPLVGCYSIFKHHSARSQPPHRPALCTCNKLSSSENTKSELDQSWTEPLYRFTPHKHFHFLCVLTPKAQTVNARVWVFRSFKSCQLDRANVYCSSYPPADD